MKHIIIIITCLFTASCTTIQDSTIRTVYQNPQFVATPTYTVLAPNMSPVVVAPPVYYNNWGWGGGGWGRGWGGCW